MADHHQFVVAAHFALERGFVRKRFDEADVDGMFHDPMLDRLGIADHQARADVWIAGFEFPEDAGQHEFGDRGRCADHQRAADLAGQFGEAHVHLGRQAQNFFGITEHHLAGRCQRNTSVAAIKQARVEVLFELLDLESHGRLGHEQYIRRLGKRQLFGNRMKNLQTTIGHFRYLPI